MVKSNHCRRLMYQSWMNLRTIQSTFIWGNICSYTRLSKSLVKCYVSFLITVYRMYRYSIKFFIFNITIKPYSKQVRKVKMLYSCSLLWRYKLNKKLYSFRPSYSSVKPALVTTCLQRPHFFVPHENSFSLKHVRKEPVYKDHFLCFAWAVPIDRFDCL